jgi:protein-S-isoprenylcysteine O-methyltransferase Ste14
MSDGHLIWGLAFIADSVFALGFGYLWARRADAAAGEPVDDSVTRPLVNPRAGAFAALVVAALSALVAAELFASAGTRSWPLVIVAVLLCCLSVLAVIERRRAERHMSTTPASRPEL